MEAFFVGVCFCDLNVVAQENRTVNEAMLQALANCNFNSLECIYELMFIYLPEYTHVHTQMGMTVLL